MNSLEKLRVIEEQIRCPGEGNASTYRRLAGALSESISTKPSWTWNYIHQLLRLKLPISVTMEKAISKLYMDLQPIKIPIVEEVIVNAPVGLVPSGTYIGIPARKCDYEICARFFIPSNPNQRFCSKRCRRLYGLSKRKAVS